MYRWIIADMMRGSVALFVAIVLVAVVAHKEPPAGVSGGGVTELGDDASAQTQGFFSALMTSGSFMMMQVARRSSSCLP